MQSKQNQSVWKSEGVLAQEARQRAMDSAAAPADPDDIMERNRRTAREALETATRRQRSGMDAATRKRFFEQCDRFIHHVIAPWEARQKAEDERRSDPRPVMDALLRQRAQSVKESRRKVALDSIAAQRAEDDYERQCHEQGERELADYSASIKAAGERMRRAYVR
jgi:hypothetical protein